MIPSMLNYFDIFVIFNVFVDNKVRKYCSFILHGQWYVLILKNNIVIVQVKITKTFQARIKTNKKLSTEHFPSNSAMFEEDSDSVDDLLDDEVDNEEDPIPSTSIKNIKSITANKHLLELKDTLGT